MLEAMSSCAEINEGASRQDLKPIKDIHEEGGGTEKISKTTSFKDRRRVIQEQFERVTLAYDANPITDK